MLDRLHVRQFRNIENVDLAPAAGVNWIIGANAAGKTALLEAVYCLSRGRSFRGKRHGALVMRGTQGARVQGWFEGVRGRESVQWTLRVGRGMEREPPLGEQQQLVRLICESTHALVEGEPSLRRRFLDWNLGLFSAEAVAAIGRYRRIAGQRNAWLRAGGPGRPVWDQPYAAALAEVFGLRQRFLGLLSEGFTGLARASGWFAGMTVEWEGPDADERRLAERLEGMRQADIERGFTYLGASRCDFFLRSDGERWTGSRGQGKVVGVLLQVAAEQVVSRLIGRNALWLVDDLDAELSPEWSVRLLAVLREHSEQMLVTVLPGKLEGANAGARRERMFHVEHGALTRVD